MDAANVMSRVHNCSPGEKLLAVCKNIRILPSSTYLVLLTKASVSCGGLVVSCIKSTAIVKCRDRSPYMSSFRYCMSAKSHAISSSVSASCCCLRLNESDCTSTSSPGRSGSDIILLNAHSYRELCWSNHDS
ncbi:hypothetical protein O6H91_Y185200 [Diphasiastrum complanatum]|nr:hypothetical protein O6H91_Y185200 [Diphasiastrum complanatum]